MRDAKEDILLFNLYIAQMQVNFIMDVVLLSGYNHVRARGEMTKRKYYKSFWGGAGNIPSLVAWACSICESLTSFILMICVLI